ncbi:MAG: hypothetical protein ACK41S_12050, partial [Planctomycetota bacterium]
STAVLSRWCPLYNGCPQPLVPIVQRLSSAVGAHRTTAVLSRWCPSYNGCPQPLVPIVQRLSSAVGAHRTPAVLNRWGPSFNGCPQPLGPIVQRLSSAVGPSLLIPPAGLAKLDGGTIEDNRPTLQSSNIGDLS